MFKKQVKKKLKPNLDLLKIEDIQEQRKISNAIACNEVISRSNARVIGQISAIRIVPKGQSQWLEVVIRDDTGIVNGWFFGRNTIPGMVPGANVLLAGLVQFDDGEMTIANPYYEFI